MSKVRIISVLLFLVFGVRAQNWNWVKRGGGPSWNVAYDIVTDKVGNSYITGGFYDTAYFSSTMLTGTGWNIYIAKYSANGNCVWARKAGGNGEDYGTGICFDNLGGLYLSGIFTDSIFFPTDTLVTVSNIFDALIARYDTAGNFMWVKQCGEPSYDEWSNGVGADQWGNAYITGAFGGNAMFGNTPMSAFGNSDMFLAKFAPNGNSSWVKKAGSNFGSGAGSYGDIATDKQGTSFITGYFGGTIVYGTFTLTSSLTDVFLARYDSSGACIWAKKAGGTGGDSGNGITLDKQKNIFVTGVFRNVGAFGTNSVTSYGGADIFVAKYDSLGNGIWARNAGDLGNDYGYGVCTDTLGNCYATGMFSTTAQFGTVTLNGFGSNDIYVTKYSSNGIVSWAKAAGGPDSDRGVKICNDSYGNTFVTGDFISDPAVFDTITRAGLNNAAVIFIGKIGDATVTVTTGNPESAMDQDLEVFPNPCDGIINLRGSFTHLRSISITNVIGEEVFSTKLSENAKSDRHLKIDLHELPEGIYFITLENSSIQTVKKVVLR